MKHAMRAMVIVAVAASLAGAAEPKLSFVPEGNGFRFDTGALRGALHKGGRSFGLTDVIDAESGKPIAGGAGLLSHYRLLDDRARYGVAGWEWQSQVRALPDGAVEVTWTADEAHPFDMKAVYRWKSANTIDVVTEVQARRPLRGFEVFLASYFAGFEQSLVYAAKGDGAVLVAALKEGGDWQTWVRDDGGAKLVADGRWTREPHPVNWVIKGRLAGAMGIRRELERGLVAVIMSPTEDCFAVMTPYGEEGHRSLYLSLFGRDLAAGQRAQARARMVIGRGISEADAAGMYRAYVERAASGAGRNLPRERPAERAGR